MESNSTAAPARSEWPPLAIITEGVRQQQAMLEATNARAQSIDARATGLLTVFASAALAIVIALVTAQGQARVDPNVEAGGVIGAVGLLCSAAYALFSTINAKSFLPGFTWEQLHRAAELPENEFLWHMAFTMDRHIENNIRRLEVSARRQMVSAIIAFLSITIGGAVALVHTWPVQQVLELLSH